MKYILILMLTFTNLYAVSNEGEIQVNYTSGNSSSKTINLKNKIIFKNGKNKYTNTFKFFEIKTDKVIELKRDLSFRYDRTWNNWLGYYASIGFSSDKVKKIKFKGTNGLGISAKWNKLTTELGYVLTLQKEINHFVKLKLKYVYELNKYSKFSFQTKYFKRIASPNWLLKSEMSKTYLLHKNYNLKLALEHEYDSAPIEGLENSDLKYLVLFGIKI